MKTRHDNKSFRRELIVRGVVYGTLALLIFAAAVSGEPAGRGIALRDIAYIEGQPARMSGYGLVIGLNGTGDGSVLNHSDRSLRATLGHLGIDAHDADIVPGQVAAVLVQAVLSSGAEPGDAVPIQITALGDATDLAGGRLIPLTLLSRDGRFAGNAEGAIPEGCSFPLGRAPASAYLERGLISSSSVFMNEIPGQNFVLEVRGLDRQKVQKLTALINNRFGDIAVTHSGCDIEIMLPAAYADFDERVSLVLQIASMSVDEVVPDLLVDRDAADTIPE